MSKGVPPEIAFQNHIRDELLRRFKHDTLKYSALEQGDITDTVNFIAEDVLWAFVTSSQPEDVAKLERNAHSHRAVGGNTMRQRVFRRRSKEVSLDFLYYHFV